MFRNGEEHSISKTDQVLVLLNRLHQCPVPASSSVPTDASTATIQAHRSWDTFGVPGYPGASGWPPGSATTQAALLAPAHGDPQANAYRSLAIVLGDQQRQSSARQLRLEHANNPAFHPLDHASHPASGL